MPKDPVHDLVPEVVNDQNLAAFEGPAEAVDALPQGQVLAMDDYTDDSDSEALPPPLF